MLKINGNYKYYDVHIKKETRRRHCFGLKLIARVNMINRVVNIIQRKTRPNI